MNSFTTQFIPEYLDPMINQEVFEIEGESPGGNSAEGFIANADGSTKDKDKKRYTFGEIWTPLTDGLSKLINSAGSFVSQDTNTPNTKTPVDEVEKKSNSTIIWFLVVLLVLIVLGVYVIKKK